MDVFQENGLVSEQIVLHSQVQAVIHVVFNLLRFTVSSQSMSVMSSHPTPGYLLRCSSTGSALSLTCVHMPALPAGQGVFLALRSRMDRHRFLDGQPVFDQLLNLLTGVGVRHDIGLNRGRKREASSEAGTNSWLRLQRRKERRVSVERWVRSWRVCGSA